LVDGEDARMTRLQRDVHIPIYWLLVGLMVMVGSPILSIFASVEIANSNRERAERAAAAAAAKAAEDARLKTCLLFGALLDSFIDEPPTTKSGEAFRRTYLEFYNDKSLHCQPPRTK
jgi:hypothetical protein